MTIEELTDIVTKLPWGSVGRVCKMAGVSRKTYHRYMAGENKTANPKISEAILTIYTEQSFIHLRARCAQRLIEKLYREGDGLTPEEFKDKLNEIQKEVYGPSYVAPESK